MTTRQCTSSNHLGKGQSRRRPTERGRGRSLGPCSAAVAKARLLGGPNLLIHEDAARGLQDLDAAPQGSSWGRKIDRGLTALDAYGAAVDDGFRGDFWQWCLRSGHADAWPATPKKLAMRESDTVMNNSRLCASRMLPVRRDVAASGMALMQPHLKIAEGGGDLAPRVYFMLDTRTSLVHVGYIGPHKHMRNTRS